MTVTETKDGRGRPSRESIYRNFATAIKDLQSWGGLPTPREAREMWDDLWHLEAHHSTAIEGNTLVLREVKELLDNNRAVGSKELGDYMEVLGYGEASKWVYGRALEPGDWVSDDLINLTEIRRVHAMVMEKVWAVRPHPDAYDSEGPGSFRQHDIRPFGEGMTPPSFVQVPAEIGGWVDAVNQLRRDLDADSIKLVDVPERLAKLHRDFEGVHPFLDGNGRTGRVLLNLILVRLGWPPAIILKKDRPKYLKALQRADKEDYGPLGEQICRSVINNLHFLIPEIAGPSKFVPLKALADDELSYNALRQAATRGRLEAERLPDGSWRSSRRAIEKYKDQRYKRSQPRPSGED